MEAPDPSPNWTSEERLQVIGFLANGLNDYSRGVRFVSPAVVAAVMDRIGFVATRPSEFLHRNRRKLLESVEEIVRIYTGS